MISVKTSIRQYYYAHDNQAFFEANIINRDKLSDNINIYSLYYRQRLLNGILISDENKNNGMFFHNNKFDNFEIIPSQITKIDMSSIISCEYEINLSFGRNAIIEIEYNLEDFKVVLYKTFNIESIYSRSKIVNIFNLFQQDLNEVLFTIKEISNLDKGKFNIFLNNYGTFYENVYNKKLIRIPISNYKNAKQDTINDIIEIYRNFDFSDNIIDISKFNELFEYGELVKKLHQNFYKLIKCKGLTISIGNKIYIKNGFNDTFLLKDIKYDMKKYILFNNIHLFIKDEVEKILLS